jgi:sugar/nucleoside kinase (ribokinase family)
MEASRLDVVCVGILVADIFVPPMDRLPLPGELARVNDLPLSTGGCAANTGIDLAKLGARVSVVGKVGNDAFADFIRQDLKSKGVDVGGLRVSSDMPTSRTVILTVIGDDRRYIHTVGANSDLRVPDINLDLVKQAKVLYVGGYLLFPGVDQASLADLLRYAKQNGVKTVLDVAGVNSDHNLDHLKEVLPFTDAFLPNYDEAKILTQNDDPLRQAEIFVSLGVGTAVITMGALGVVACQAGEDGVHKYLHAGVYPIHLIDPSGGGDAFDAGYIIGLLEDWDMERSITFASAIGGSACTKLGTTAGVFTRVEAEKFIAANNLKLNA